MQTCFVSNDIIDRDSQHNYHPRMVSYKSLGGGEGVKQGERVSCSVPLLFAYMWALMTLLKWGNFETHFQTLLHCLFCLEFTKPQ